MLRSISRFWYRRSLGLLLIRIGTGAVFFAHGLMKLQNLAGTESFFTKGLHLPPGTATLIMLFEMVGGVMLIAGVGARIAGAVLGFEMLAAIYLTGIDKGWPSHELEFLLMAISFGIALGGAGKLRMAHLFEHDE
jgi:uncharacterized membrane protein YphA (DoxX/SURF4 family)